MTEIVIVTGASRGIGAATARLLGREKAASSSTIARRAPKRIAS
jgi:NAD(P)-dependent dehydrogenase (short-subunit alcohol dehydrogenase family)